MGRRAGWEALGGAPCHCLGTDMFLGQEVQMMPGQMRRISRRRTVLFGQCQVVMGLIVLWAGCLTSSGCFHDSLYPSLVQMNGLTPFF